MINIVLVCLGRHPIQPGGRAGNINPDIPKLPRPMVDRIPLVIYIPVPPTDTPAPESFPTPNHDGEHVYPPEAGKPKPKRRFFFFKRKPRSSVEQDKPPTADIEADAAWEKSDYPFVKLEANRAACAICLMDFELPRRAGQDRSEPNAAEPLRLLACGHVFHVS